MSNYRRSNSKGGTYFFTVVSFKRRPIFTDDAMIHAMRDAVHLVKQQLPFIVDAWVTLPDHIHTMWTLPPNDGDYGKRWGLIKRQVSRACEAYWAPIDMLSLSNIKRDEKGIFQRRFWAHDIMDDEDFSKHMDYIHFNPVGHGLVKRAVDWKYSTFHKYCKSGLYTIDWSSEFKDGDFGESI